LLMMNYRIDIVTCQAGTQLYFVACFAHSYSALIATKQAAAQKQCCPVWYIHIIGLILLSLHYFCSYLLT